LGKKIKRSRVRSKGKESAKAFVESVDQKMNVLDKWLFGEDVKERSEKAKLQQRQQGRGEDGGAGGEEQEGQEGAGVVEEDDDPPVLFTLNMSDLRALISFIYGYHDLIETINLEYADESFGLVSEVRTRTHLSLNPPNNYPLFSPTTSFINPAGQNLALPCCRYRRLRRGRGRRPSTDANRCPEVPQQSA
jgi:hypothetical protein